MAGALLPSLRVRVGFLSIVLATALAGCAARGAAAVPPPAAADGNLACLDRPEIDAWEHRLRFDRAFRASVTDSVSRGAPYLDRVRQILAEAGLPPTLALLPVVESGFHP